MLTPLLLLALQLTVMLALGLALGRLVQLLKFPAIFGELGAGILLGPTVLQAVAPALWDGLFGPGAGTAVGMRNAVARLGLLLFMFLAGAEIKLGDIGQNARRVLLVALGGLVVPFVVGYASVVLAPTIWGDIATTPAFPFMIGGVLTITALPILTRVLLDLGLLRTPLGGIISSAGAVIGLVTFVSFAVLVGFFAPSPTSDPTRLLISVTIFLVVSFGVGLFLGPRISAYLNALPPMAVTAGQAIGWLSVAILAGAALAEFIGIEAFFGAFLLGVFLANTNDSVIAPLSVTTRQFLAPIFFINVGIGINFTQGFDLALIGYVFVIAVFGKMLGVGLGAKIGGFSTNEALAMGVGMSARGAVGVILAQSALTAKLIDQRSFIALTVVALFTALLAGPVMSRIIGSPSPTPRPVTD